MVDPERLYRLLLVLSLAFVWAFRVGVWLHRLKPVPAKRHGRLARASSATGWTTFSGICGPGYPSKPHRPPWDLTSPNF